MAEHFKSMEVLSHAEEDELKTISDIGEKMANEIVDFFKTPRNLGIINGLQEAGLNMFQENKALSRNLQGKTFVITGTLPTLDRREAANLIEANGGKVSTNVSKKTDYLLVGEKSGSKQTKAQKLGIEIIDESQFLALVTNGEFVL